MLACSSCRFAAAHGSMYSLHNQELAPLRHDHCLHRSSQAKLDLVRWMYFPTLPQRRVRVIGSASHWVSEEARKKGENTSSSTTSLKQRSSWAKRGHRLASMSCDVCDVTLANGTDLQFSKVYCRTMTVLPNVIRTTPPGLLPHLSSILRYHLPVAALALAS